MATPVINPYESRISAPGRPGPALMQGDSIAPGLAALGGALQQREQQNGIVEASRLMAQARVDMTKFRDDAQLAWKPGVDLPAQIMGGFKDYHEKLLEGTSNPFAKKLLDQHMTNFGAEMGVDAVTFQNSQEVAGRVQGSQESASTAAVAVKADPSKFDAVYQEQLSALNALQVDAATKGKLAANLREQMSVAAAKTLGERDPYTTMVALTKEKSGNSIIDRLSIAGRQEVQDHILTVQRMVQAQEDHALAVQERNQRKASDAYLKNGIELAQNGQLTPQYIESHHATFEPQAYQYLYGLLRGKGETTDPHTYAPLIERALKGEDVSEEAKGALYSGSIKLDDYTRLLEKVQTPRQNWVKRGVEYISTSAAVSQLNPDPAAAQRKAAMLDEWDTWTGENPKASDSQAREAYMGIVKSYALIDLQNLTLTKPLPKFVVGNRTQMDFDATAKATVKAYEDGKLTQPEFNRQAQLLKEWEDAFEKAHGEPKPAVKK